MAWFKRQSGELDTSGERKMRTEGLWVKCDNCRQIIWKKDLEDNLNVCPKCDKHFRIDARSRLGPALRRQPVRNFRRQPGLDRPAQVRRPESLFVTSQTSPHTTPASPMPLSTRKAS